MSEQKSLQEKESKLSLTKTSAALGAAILIVAVSVACSRTKQAEVTAAAAITRGLQRDVEVVGSLAADEEVVVSAQAAGELSQLNVDFGSFVTQGQVIATIDQR